MTLLITFSSHIIAHTDGSLSPAANPAPGTKEQAVALRDFLITLAGAAVV